MQAFSDVASPSVSVIIPTFNRAGIVTQAIDSVLAQSPPPHELIVVDDGSTDETLRVLKKYGESINVVSQENGGASSARNRGCAVASGNWLAFLDSDDLWYPDRMAKLVEDIALADPAVVAHVANVRFTGSGPNCDLFDVMRLEIANGPATRIGKPLGMFLHTFFLSGAAIRTEIFAKLGGFDTSFPTDEDTEMAQRLALRGAFLVRGDLAAQVIRHPDDEGALSNSRRKDPAGAVLLKERQFRAIIDSASGAAEQSLACRALSSCLLDKASLIRAGAMDGSIAATLLASVKAHPNKVVGILKAVSLLAGRRRARRGHDRTVAKAA